MLIQANYSPYVVMKKMTDFKDSDRKLQILPICT